MSSVLKVSLIVIGLIVFAGIAIYFYLYNKLDGLQETATDKDYEITFNDINDTVFIKASSWGLTGDHIQIQVSSFPMINRSYDSTKNYIFYEPTIYYEQKQDTLIIYTPSLSDVPSTMNTSVKIRQVQINGPEEINKYKEHYKSLGLNRVSVYD